MNPLSPSRIFSLCVSLVVAAAGTHDRLAAAEAVGEPQGFLVLETPAQSDMYFSLPYHSAVAFDGVVAGVSGATVTPQVPPGGLGWTAGQFTSTPHYLLVSSGSLEGGAFTVTASTTGAVTVDPQGADLAARIGAGAVMRLIPHWTLATMFPAQAGVATTTSITGVGVGTLIMRVSLQAGVNLAASDTFYYYAGIDFGGPGWRRKGTTPTTKFDQASFPAGTVFIYRNATAASANWVATGAVQMAANRATVRTLQASIDQDNPVGLAVSTNLTLAQTGLAMSGAIAPTASITGVGADLVMTYLGSATGFNLAASASYYYYSGSDFGGPGWRRKGTSPTALQNNTLVFKPGTVLLIRKAGAATLTSAEWALLPPYLQ